MARIGDTLISLPVLAMNTSAVLLENPGMLIKSSRVTQPRRSIPGYSATAWAISVSKRCAALTRLSGFCLTCSTTTSRRHEQTLGVQAIGADFIG
jgi:hypothetical protein